MKPTRLIFAKNISKKLKKNIWLKLESDNITGSHKDRESLAILRYAIKKKFNSVGCASTGNLAVSLAYHSKINNINCYIWIPKKNINILNLNLLKNLGAKIQIRNTELSNLYNISEKYMKKNKILSANPGGNKIKIKANSNIIKEIYFSKKKINNFVTCVNNGSHFLGLKQEIKKNHNLYGITSRSIFANSINSFSKYEIYFNEKKNNFFKNMLEVNDCEILAGYHLLKSENIFAEPSSMATVGALKNKLFLNLDNICCIITGNSIRHLSFIKNFLLKYHSK